MSNEVNLDLLIELIQQYPYIYDMKVKDYKNNNLKEKNWQEISTVLQISVEDCKRLWKNLRDRFTKEKRIAASGSEAPESSWPYFEKMLFYSKCLVPRKTISATPKLVEERAGSSCFSEASSRPWNSMNIIVAPTRGSPSCSEQQSSADENTIRDDSDTENHIIVNTPTTSQTQYTPKQQGPQKKKSKVVHDIDEVVQVAKQLVLKMAEPTDINTTFGAYVVARLQDMPPEEAKQKRKSILLLLEDD